MSEQLTEETDSDIQINKELQAVTYTSMPAPDIN